MFHKDYDYPKIPHFQASTYLALFITYILEMSSDDEETPPLLVNVDAVDGGGTLELSKPIKVPITIITGKA